LGAGQQCATLAVEARAVHFCRRASTAQCRQLGFRRALAMLLTLKTMKGRCYALQLAPTQTVAELVAVKVIPTPLSICHK
jgi:hypothetical protein